jgi:hypothetical protein
LKYSEDFSNAVWSVSTGATVTPSAIQAPDGNTSGTYLEETAVTDNHFVRLSSSVTVISGATYTFSVFAKKAERNWVSLSCEDASGERSWFNLDTGSLGTKGSSHASYGIEDVGNGWYRCFVTYTAVDSNFQPYIFINTADNQSVYAGAVGNGIYIWGAHLYRSDLGGMVDNPDRGDSYVPTTSAAVYLPRRGHYVYNGQEWTNRGLLLESEARTNYVDLSDGSGLGVVRASISAGTSVWIDGVSTMVKIVENTESNSHAGYENPVGAFTDDTVYTFSVYLKADERSWAKLAIKKKNASIVGAWFDLSNGVLGTIEAGTASATLEDCGNGIYRCSVSVDIGTGANAQQVFVSPSTADNTISYTGDGSSGLECYGLQFEAGSTPSSYMPTEGATFTRAAETLTVAAADLPSTISPSGSKAALVTAGWTITDGGAV